MDRLCDNCKREPEPMTTPDGETAWFFVIFKGQDEPIALMSSLKYNFQVCLDRNPILNDGESVICGKCLEAMYPEGKDEKTIQG